MKQNLLKVGKIKDAHGIRGELFVRLFSQSPEWLSQLQELLLSMSEDPGADLLRYNIEKFRPHKNGLIIKAKEINDRTTAESLKKCFMFIPQDMLKTESQSEFFLNEILNFAAFNHTEPCGKVVGFSTNTAQDLAVIEYKEKQYEVPLVDEFIAKIDYQKKEIHFQLPEGLIE